MDSDLEIDTFSVDFINQKYKFQACHEVWSKDRLMNLIVSRTSEFKKSSVCGQYVPLFY